MTVYEMSPPNLQFFIFASLWILSCTAVKAPLRANRELLQKTSPFSTFLQESIGLGKLAENNSTKAYFDQLREAFSDLKEDFDLQFNEEARINNDNLKRNLRVLDEESNKLGDFNREILYRQAALRELQNSKEKKLGILALKQHTLENLKEKLKKISEDVVLFDLSLKKQEEQFSDLKQILNESLDILNKFLLKDSSFLGVENIMKARNRLNAFATSAKVLGKSSKFASTLAMFSSLRSIISKTDFSDESLVKMIIGKLNEMKNIAQNLMEIELEQTKRLRTDSEIEVKTISADILKIEAQIEELGKDYSSLENAEKGKSSEIEHLQTQKQELGESIRLLEGQIEKIKEMQALYESNYEMQKETLNKANGWISNLMPTL